MPQAIYEILVYSNGEAAFRKLGDGMEKTTAAAGRTQAAVTRLNSSFIRLATRVAEFFAIYEGVDQLKTSYDLFIKQSVAVEQLSTTYRDNAKYTKERLEDLKSYAIQEEGLTGVYREQIDAMETSLLAHHDIRVSYKDIIPAIIDYSEATGTSAVEATKQFSRVLGNPLMAMRLLRQAHIDITREQQKWLTGLYETGHYEEYQSYLVQQLAERYKGAAADILAANPGLQLELAWRQVQSELGKLEAQILTDFIPTIKVMFTYLHEWVIWGEQNKETIETWIKVGWKLFEVFVAIKTATLAYKETLILYNGVVKTATWVTGLFAVAEGEATAATEGLNVAMLASPFSVAVVGAMGLAAAYVILGDDADSAANKIKGLVNAADTDPYTGMTYGDETKPDLTKYLTKSTFDRLADIQDLRAQIQILNERKAKDIEQGNFAPGVDTNALQSNGLVSLLSSDSYKDLLLTNNLLAKDNYLLSLYESNKDTAKTADNSNTGKSGDDNLITSDDLKGGTHNVNNWNIRNFGINESTFRYEGAQASKQDMYNMIMEVLTAAMRDAQINTAHS